jgi:hypothetical protein
MNNLNLGLVHPVALVFQRRDSITFVRNYNLSCLYCTRVTLYVSVIYRPSSGVSCTRCGKLTSFFELSGLKRRGAPGGWAWSRSREGILKLCDIVVH